MKLSLQTWTIRDEIKRNYAKSIRETAKLGFDGIEFALGYGGLSPVQMKELLNETGLVPVGTHANIADEIEKEIEFHKEIGTKYIVSPGMKLTEKLDVENAINCLNRAAELAKPYGIKVGYHNHDKEFEKLDGEYKLDILAKNTSDDVILELDVFWARYAGVDPVEYIKKHGSKIELIHIKQMSSEKTNVDILDGIIVFSQIKAGGDISFT